MLNNNPYELLYMSRLKDRYAFEALFTQTRGILYNVVSQSIDSYKPLAPHFWHAERYGTSASITAAK